MATNPTQATYSQEVNTVTVGEHEVTSWSDGSVTIAHWQAQFEPENPALDYVHLDAEQVAALRSTLG